MSAQLRHSFVRRPTVHRVVIEGPALKAIVDRAGPLTDYAGKFRYSRGARSTGAE